MSHFDANRAASTRQELNSINLGKTALVVDEPDPATNSWNWLSVQASILSSELIGHLLTSQPSLYWELLVIADRSKGDETPRRLRHIDKEIKAWLAAHPHRLDAAWSPTPDTTLVGVTRLAGGPSFAPNLSLQWRGPVRLGPEGRYEAIHLLEGNAASARIYAADAAEGGGSVFLIRRTSSQGSGV